MSKLTEYNSFPATWLMFALLATSADRASADWPLERGDASGSAYAEADFTEQPEELWRFTAEDSGFEATPVVSDGKVYIGDFDGTFYALHLDNGKPVWKKSFKDSGFISSAAVVDGKVYVGDFNGIFRCLNAVDGKVLWEYEARGEMYAGPNVVNGRVLVTTEAGELLSLDAETGELQWRFEIDAPLRCWPTVIDGQALLAGCDSKLHAVELNEGKEVKSMELAGQTGSTPVRVDESVLFGTVTGTFYRIEDFKEHWSFQDDKGQESFSAATDGEVVVYSSKGKRIYALELQEGEPKWDASVRKPIASAPIIAGNAVIFGTKRGDLIALDLSSGERLWEFEAGGDFLAPAAVSNSLLLIANGDGTLYCFGSLMPRDESRERPDRSDETND